MDCGEGRVVFGVGSDGGGAAVRRAADGEDGSADRGGGVGVLQVLLFCVLCAGEVCGPELQIFWADFFGAVFRSETTSGHGCLVGVERWRCWGAARGNEVRDEKRSDVCGGRYFVRRGRVFFMWRARCEARKQEAMRFCDALIPKVEAARQRDGKYPAAIDPAWIEGAQAAGRFWRRANITRRGARCIASTSGTRQISWVTCGRISAGGHRRVTGRTTIRAGYFLVRRLSQFLWTGVEWTRRSFSFSRM